MFPLRLVLGSFASRFAWTLGARRRRSGTVAPPSLFGRRGTTTTAMFTVFLIRRPTTFVVVFARRVPRATTPTLIFVPPPGGVAWLGIAVVTTTVVSRATPSRPRPMTPRLRAFAARLGSLGVAGMRPSPAATGVRARWWLFFTLVFFFGFSRQNWRFIVLFIFSWCRLKRTGFISWRLFNVNGFILRWFLLQFFFQCLVFQLF